jgi:hypothetical protein
MRFNKSDLVDLGDIRCQLVDTNIPDHVTDSQVALRAGVRHRFDAHLLLIFGARPAYHAHVAGIGCVEFHLVVKVNYPL